MYLVTDMSPWYGIQYAFRSAIDVTFSMALFLSLMNVQGSLILLVFFGFLVSNARDERVDVKSSLMN